jgi:methylmalonyl-CoA/ethylmalonyl-CoA epimerase
MKMGNDIKIVSEDNTLLKGVVHISLVVRDADKTVEKLAKYGIGPFKFHQSNYTSPLPGKYQVSARMKYGYSLVGNIIWELIETLEGETEYSDYLEAHGEGIHHLGFPTPMPIEAELERWSKRGVKASKVGKEGDSGEGWAYMDTVDDMGFIIETLCYKNFNKYINAPTPAFDPFKDLQ